MRIARILLFGLLTFGVSYATELQGVLTDWNCTQDMVRQGREKVLKNRAACRLDNNPQRAAYGLITDSKKFYKIDPKNNDRVLQILNDSPSKDNLKVVINGDVQGDTVTIKTISLL
jgi:hypothetical protein